MATFPQLKTGAVAQYPARREIGFRNQAMQFVDGREQRYRDCAGPMRRWEIRLTQLDEGEIARIEQFFTENEGAFGDFEFTDPWDGRVYASCSVEGDDLNWTALGEANAATALTIRENRG